MTRYQAAAMNSRSGDVMILLPGLNGNKILLSAVFEEEVIDYGPLTTARVVSMVVLGLVSFGLGLLPIGLVRVFKLDLAKMQKGKSKIMLSMLLCFGAGVLLCTTFLHMLPELREEVELLQASGSLPLTSHTVPLTELFFLTGFFAVYLVEELVHLFYGSQTHGHGHSHEVPEIKDFEKQENSENYMNSSSIISKNKSIKDSLLESMSGILVVLVLSFHAIFEGLAVGLETEAANVWYLMGAVAAHKFVIAFCVGTELLMAGTKRALLVLYVATFAAVTPLGIGIGMAVTGSSTVQTETVATVVLKGMAAGTLLYVVFFEVMQRERQNSPNAGPFQFIAVIIGLAVMFGLLNAAGHDDHHHDDDDHDSHGHQHGGVAQAVQNVTELLLETIASHLAGVAEPADNHHDLHH